MKEQKKDRRVRRTQKLLKDSLISLMQEKEFKNITVKDVTERADINRGTFYLHYTDTYDLLQKIQEDVLSDFEEMIAFRKESGCPDSLLSVLMPIIEYVSDNSAVCHIFFEITASNEFFGRYRSLLFENGKERIMVMFPNAQPDQIKYYFDFITYGIIGMLHQWYMNGRNLTKEQLAVMANNAVMGAAQQLLT